jgi:hydrogenase maturation protease
MAQWLVIGIGNEFRGDDAIGCIVARKLRGVVPDQVRVIEHQGDGTALLRYFQEEKQIILIDAVRSGRSPGFIHRLDLLNDSVPANFIFHSSHQFGAIEAVALSRELHQLPSRLILYGIEATAVGMGEPLSSDVEKTSETILGRILNEIAGIPDAHTRVSAGHHPTGEKS